MIYQSTPIEEEEKVLIECMLIQVGQEYWRLTKRADAPNGRIFVARSEKDLWCLWERAKINYNLRFLFYD